MRIEILEMNAGGIEARGLNGQPTWIDWDLASAAARQTDDEARAVYADLLARAMRKVMALRWEAVQAPHTHEVAHESNLRGYSGSVATSADFVNESAAGGITVTIHCKHCGGIANVNRNGSHEERGAWHASDAIPRPGHGRSDLKPY